MRIDLSTNLAYGANDGSRAFKRDHMAAIGHKDPLAVCGKVRLAHLQVVNPYLLIIIEVFLGRAFRQLLFIRPFRCRQREQRLIAEVSCRADLLELTSSDIISLLIASMFLGCICK